jgi:hypothetical protein
MNYCGRQTRHSQQGFELVDDGLPAFINRHCFVVGYVDRAALP